MSTAATTLKTAHRVNSDGTYDSICLDCFRTISSTNDESDLERSEQDHICSLEDLFRFSSGLDACGYVDVTLSARHSDY